MHVVPVVSTRPRMRTVLQGGNGSVPGHQGTAHTHQWHKDGWASTNWGQRGAAAACSAVMSCWRRPGAEDGGLRSLSRKFRAGIRALPAMSGRLAVGTWHRGECGGTAGTTTLCQWQYGWLLCSTVVDRGHLEYLLPR